MMSQSKRGKTSRSHFRDRLPIVLSIIALVFSGLSALSAYWLYEITKQSLEASGPNFRLSHYVSKEFEVKRWGSTIPSLRIASSDLCDDVRTNDAAEQCYYLWLIIENVGNSSARCLNLISISYTFNKENQTMLAEVAE